MGGPHPNKYAELLFATRICLTVLLFATYSYCMSTAERSTSKNPEQERVGETLSTFRERYGYTQESFGTALGISRSYISLIEIGTKPLPDRLLSRAADLLGIKPLAIKRPDSERSAA